MPFPHSQRVLFHQNPLVEVICQLRFPPILDITARDPAEFQDRVRATYPLYRVEHPQGLPQPIAELLQAGQLAEASALLTHKFITEDEQRGISLTRDFVAVWYKNYTRWEDMRAAIDSTRAVLEDTYAPAFYTRLGLRYIDRIDRQTLGIPETPWRDLLNPAVVGILGDEGVHGQVNAASSESILQLVGIPNAFVKLRHGLRKADASEQYLFDMDFYLNVRSQGGELLEILDQFNRKAGNLFRWGISNTLRDRLQPEVIPD